MKNEEQRLDELLRSYRESVGEPEPSANFMPGMWAKIEARRSVSMLFGAWRWAAVCLTAASLMLGVWLGYASSNYENPGFESGVSSYVDTLEEHDEELLMADFRR